MSNSMLVIDSGEKSEFLRCIDKVGLRYKIEEIKFYYCDKCNRVYEEDGKCEDCGIELKSEKAGDITNEDHTFILERKSFNNLYSSIHNGELYDQLHRIQMFFKKPILLFEGSLAKLAVENPDRKEQILSIPGACASYGVSFINFDNMMTTAKMLKYINYKSGRKPKLRLKRKVIYEKLPKMVNLIMGIKGIGKKTAYDLYLEFKNIYKLSIAIKLNPKKILDIRNIGPATFETLEKWLVN